MYMNIDYICEKHPSVFPREIYTFERFKWAYQVVQSRAFGRRLPWSSLVPFSDCLNHSNVATKYDYDVDANKAFRLFPSGGRAGYLKGAEVFNSYGRRANDNLLVNTLRIYISRCS